MKDKCRICLQSFESAALIKFLDSRDCVEVYQDVTSFEVLPNEPQSMCSTCAADLLLCANFLAKCKQAEEELKGKEVKVELDEPCYSPEAVEIEVEEELEEDESFRCSFCSMVFASVIGLRTHSRKTHKGQELYECACGRKFFHSTELEKHLTICVKTTKEGRKEREKVKKDGDKSICCHCGKIMAAHYLDRHIKDVHERDFIPEYRCDLCNDKCRTKVIFLA